MNKGSWVPEVLEHMKRIVGEPNAPRLAEVMRVSHRFRLPMEAQFYPDQEFFHAPIEMRLPFDNIVLEYPMPEYEGTDLSSSTRRVVVALDSDEGVHVFGVSYMNPFRRWTLMPIKALIPRKRYIPTMTEEQFAVTLHHVSEEVKATMLAKGITVDDVSHDLDSEIIAVFRFVDVLASRRTQMREVQPDTKLTNAQRRRGQEPLLSYHVLDILPGPVPVGEGKGGHHASPRPHDRRGFTRHYKDGRETWVRPTWVKGKGDGLVIKDYNVHKAEGKELCSQCGTWLDANGYCGSCKEKPQ